jgi:hypothetical protein
MAIAFLPLTAHPKPAREKNIISNDPCSLPEQWKHSFVIVYIVWLVINKTKSQLLKAESIAVHRLRAQISAPSGTPFKIIF